MNYAVLLARWAWRAWPVLLLALVIALHIATLQFLPANSALVNKLTGTVLQILGGLIVLHSLDGNLGLFKKQSLLSALYLWLRDFPRGRTINIVASGIGMAGAMGMAASLSSKVTATTVEQRLAELERRLEETDKRLRDFRAETESRMSAIKTELSSSIAKVDTGLRELANKVETAALGGLKQQLFGVLLVIYGAGVSVFA